VSPRLRPGASGGGPARGWARYLLGRVLQVTGLMVTLVAATAFFGTPDTTAMLRMTLAGVCVYLPGWWLARKEPSARR
jgi:hypothetical protein